MQNTSPRPWRVRSNEGERVAILDANGEVVADWVVGSASCEELGDNISRENAELIVVAVNAFEGNK